MPKEKKVDSVKICPTCSGVGHINGALCKTCGGYAMVLDLNLPGSKTSELYYFGRKFSSLSIIQKRHERKIRVLINGMFFAFGFLGFLILLKVFYDMHLEGFVLYKEFYKVIYVKSEMMVIWWVSVLADMYLIYRISRESKVKSFIRKRPMVEISSELSDHEFDWNVIKKSKMIDMSASFDQESMEVLEETYLMTAKLKHKYLENIHIFVILLGNTQANMVFARLSESYKDLAIKVKSSLKRISQTGKTEFSVEAREALLRSYLRAYTQRKKKVQVTDLLYAVALVEGDVSEILYDRALTPTQIGHVVEWVDLQRELVRKYHELRLKAKFKPKKSMNRTYTAIETKHLNAISTDMTLYARGGAYGPVIGREEEIAEVFRVLSVDKIGAILVGPSGVGKKSIVEAVAQLMVKEDVPKILEDKRLVEMSVSGLIAGASAVGEMEQRIINVMNEVAKSKNIVLFIEDIHHMVGVSAKGGESMDVAEVLAEQLQSRNFLVFASTTPEYYKKFIEKSSLAKALQKVVIIEPDDSEVIRVLEAKALVLEGKNHIYFSYQAIEETVKLSKRYMHESHLPEKAIKILEEVALTVAEKKGEKAIVTREDVAEVISSLIKIPVTEISVDETKKLLNLEMRMHERIIGQEEAVKLVASALRRARTELRKEGKPIASFLFLGSTGIGKTEVAKTLSRIYFGSEKNMIRVDMSEYQGPDALAKLIGDARSGTIGYLTEAVRKAPFSLVLLDEVEKANLDILNVFLQVLDDGRLTDASGKTIDFTNTIIIGTSNAGTSFIQDSIKKNIGLDEIRQTLINTELKKFFRPELLNRFDGIVVFKPLEMDQVVKIARIFMDQLAVQLEDKGVKLEVSDEALSDLARLGYDQTLGARPLRRVIQDKVEDKLAKLFLEGRIDRRDTVLLKAGLEVEVSKGKQI